MRARSADSGQAGNAALELVLLAFVFVLLLGLVIGIGRTVTARNAIALAAQDAARQASVAGSPASARVVAVSTARAALSADGLDCAPRVAMNLAGFNRPPGQPATVTATVSCTVGLADLAVPGLPGRVTLRASFTSPLDVYRSR